jgi:hypothetical protein
MSCPDSLEEQYKVPSVKAITKCSLFQKKWNSGDNSLFPPFKRLSNLISTVCSDLSGQAVRIWTFHVFLSHVKSLVSKLSELRCLSLKPPLDQPITNYDFGRTVKRSWSGSFRNAVRTRAKVTNSR